MIKNEKNQTLSICKVGEKGQIVIPKELRDMFNIKPGDQVLVLGDKERGIAIMPQEEYMKFAQEILNHTKGE